MNKNWGSQLENILFRKPVVFGTTPLGYPGDMSINLVRHINEADIILTETLISFYQIVLDANKFFAQFGYSSVEVKPRAQIYSYVPDDSNEYKEQVSQKIIDAVINHGKKVLVLSEEGYSNYMDPAEFLKNDLIKNQIEFDTLHGPCMVIATIATSFTLANKFIFAGNPQWYGKDEVYHKLLKFKATEMPIVFSFDSHHLEDSLNIIKTVFQEYFGDFCINLSKPNENHIRGHLDKIISEYPNALKDPSTDRYTMLISPIFLHHDKYEY